MTAPRHLWSGDWQGDSAATAEELARRRAENEQPAAEPPPARTPRARVRSRPSRHLRGTLVLVLAMLVSAGAAFAGVLTLFGNP